MKLGAVLLALIFAAPPAFAAHQEPTFHSASSELVVLPVVVTDRRGEFVSNLSQDSFAVYDNGRPMPIELFSGEDAPVTVGLILDASGSMAPKVGEVAAAALAFAKSSNPNDELFAIRFNDNARNVMADDRTIRADDFDALERTLHSIRPTGRTALYDGLAAGFDRLEHATRARKALILISDGGDNASWKTERQILQRARESNVAIYTIGLYDDNNSDRDPGLLQSLAQASGGERFLPRSAGSLMAACERIAREIRAGYTIGYTPPSRDGAFHHVRVDVSKTGGRQVDVRTRPGYFAGNGTAGRE